MLWVLFFAIEDAVRSLLRNPLFDLGIHPPQAAHAIVFAVQPYVENS